MDKITKISLDKLPWFSNIDKIPLFFLNLMFRQKLYDVLDPRIGRFRGFGLVQRDRFIIPLRRQISAFGHQEFNNLKRFAQINFFLVFSLI